MTHMCVFGEELLVSSWSKELRARGEDLKPIGKDLRR
jgi:hypothetical protein